MTKLELLENIKDVLSVYKDDEYLLLKRKDSLVLFDSSLKVLRGISDATFAKKILVDRNRRYVILISSLFCSKTILYSFPQLTPVLTFTDIAGKHVFYKDAVFSPDGNFLYLLADVADLNQPKTLLLKVNLAYQCFEVFFSEESFHFDSLFYSDSKKAVVLLQSKGKVSFFCEKGIVETLKTPTFEKLYFIDWGKAMLLSSPAGFILCSMKGKTIRNCDFLLPKEVKAEERICRDFAFENEIRELSSLTKIQMKRNLAEHFLDMVFVQETGALFYLTVNVNDGKTILYHYSIQSFLLKRVYPIKGKALYMELAYPYLYIHTTEGVLIYLIVQKK